MRFYKLGKHFITNSKEKEILSPKSSLDCGIDILIVHYAAYKLQAKKTEKKHTKPVFQNEFIQIRLEFPFELHFRGIRSKVLKSSGNFVFNRFFI